MEKLIGTFKKLENRNATSDGESIELRQISPSEQRRAERP
jgi:hypothetical protein